MTFINIWDKTGATHQCYDCGAKLCGFREVSEHRCEATKGCTFDEAAEKVIEQNAELLERLAK